jgi:hypothetical protein
MEQCVMKPMHLLAVGACVLSLISISSVARADFDIDMTLGATIAIPTSTAPTFVGPRVGLGLRYLITENHALGIAARAHLLLSKVTQEDLNASLSYRYFWIPSDSVRFLIGASAGVGVWPECARVISADSCGNLGAALGAEAGLQIPITEDVAITAGAEFVGRLGASDIKGMMMMPAGWAGVSF